MDLRTITILAALAGSTPLAAALPASAEVYGVPRSVHRPVYSTAAYGRFAQPYVEGAYIGAPFTNVPSPNRLVPAPWSYGTYGIPTVSGIAAPPVAQPTLTVIHAQGGRKTKRAAASGIDPETADVRVVSVSVPRR